MPHRSLQLAQVCQLKGEGFLSHVLPKQNPNAFSLGGSLSTIVFFFCRKAYLEDFSSLCPSFLDSRNYLLHSSPVLHWDNCLACHALNHISRMIQIKNGSRLKPCHKQTFFEVWYILRSGIHGIHRKSCNSTLKGCWWTAEWKWEEEGELWKDHQSLGRQKQHPWDTSPVLGLPVVFCKRQSCPKKLLLLSSSHLHILDPSPECQALMELRWELGQATAPCQK